MTRAFIAVKFSEQTSIQLKELQSKARQLSLDATFPKDLHATLAFLGEINDKQVEEVKQKLNSIKTKASTVEIKGIGFFPSEKFVKVLWTRADGLNELQKEIAQSLGYNERFEGHITLARVKTQKNLEKLKQLVKDYEIKPFGSETVKEVLLLKSTLSPSGPQYEELFVKKLS